MFNAFTCGFCAFAALAELLSKPPGWKFWFVCDLAFAVLNGYFAWGV